MVFLENTDFDKCELGGFLIRQSHILTQNRLSVVWQDICVIHECWTGIQPIHCCIIRKKDGEVCVRPEETVDGGNTFKGF